MQPTKTIKDLRELLLDEIDKLRAGKTTPANVNAVTNATGKVFTSIKLQMEYHKAVGTKPDIGFVNVLPEDKK